MNVEDFVNAVTPTVGQPCGHPHGCDEWSDHACQDGSARGEGRCRPHCTCDGENPGTCEVSLTITLADAASPEEVARRFLAVVRDAPGRTDLHLTVTPVDAGKPIDVLVTAAQQAADAAGR